jgi:hypothetical protein
MFMMTGEIVKNIIDEVYPLISEDYSDCDPKVELHKNIYERLSGVEGMTGESCAQAEYDWSENKIYLYTSRVNNEEDVIRSLIHECVHSTQLESILKELYKQGETYDTHPYEIEARKAEENWKDYIN